MTHFRETFAWTEASKFKGATPKNTPVQVVWHDGVRYGLLCGVHGNGQGLISLANGGQIRCSSKQYNVLVSNLNGTAAKLEDPEGWLRERKGKKE